MWTRILTALCIAAACFGVSAMPAAAAIGTSQSRVMTFSLGACNGAGKVLSLNATGFAANDTRYILGGAINLSVATGKVKFLILASPQALGQTVLVVSAGETGARFGMPVYFPVTSDANGNIPIVVQGACNGPGTVAGFVTVYFY